MFLPIGDTPNPPGFRAWVTWALLATNLLVWLLLTLPLSLTPGDPSDPAFATVAARMVEHAPRGVGPAEVASWITAWDLFVEHHGFKPGAPRAGDLFAALFLHANLAHLFGNSLFLWIYGDNVEHRLGRLPYLAAYLGAGVIATLTFGWFAGGSMIPLIGASGAISGVLGSYFLMFPRNRVRVLVALFPFLVDVWLVPAPIVLGLYVLLDNLLPIVLGGGGGVAYGAHVGGFVAGLGLAVVVDRLSFGRHPVVVSAEDPADCAAQARELAAGGHPLAAIRTARHGLARCRTAAGRAALHGVIGEILAAQGQTSSAFQHLVQAVDGGDDAVAADARRVLRAMPLDPRLARRLGL